MRDDLAPFASALILMAGLSPAARAQTRPDADWVHRSALYEVFVQDFSPSGDFKGVTAGLDRIHSTGATVIWIMPVNPIGVAGHKGTLGSPYASRDFRSINPALGTAADFKALVAAAHARGLRVILDWVPDHTSPDNPWIRQHPDWYFKNDSGKPSVPRDPEGKLTDWTDVRQLDYKQPGLRKEMIATMQWWLTEYDLDGLRVDVAGFMPYDFWSEAITALRKGTPRPLLFLAEWQDPLIHHSGFDLTYAWDSYDRLKAVWKGGPASTFVKAEIPDLAKLPANGQRMRFTTNHDKTAWDDPPVMIFGQGAGARAAFIAAALLPGRPLLYNGQEVESRQKLGLFERELIKWDQPKGDEARAFYAKVIALTRTEPSLIAGGLDTIGVTSAKDVIAYRRGDLVVLVNARATPVKVTVKGVTIDGAPDLLTNQRQKGASVGLEAFGTRVFRVAKP